MKVCRLNDFLLATARTKLPRRSLLFALMATAAACSSGSSDSSTDTMQPTPPAANQPPTLSGTAPSSAVQDMQYSFTPTASDPDGDTLTFTIDNMPAWANFDATSGTLNGTPTVQHIGTYTDVRISATDGQDSGDLAPFDIDVVATATGSLSLSWTPPTLNADGSSLDDLAGYRIRWGTQTGNLPNLQEVDNPGISRFVIDELAAGDYFFTVSAVDTSDNESVPSNEATGTVP